MRLIFLITNLVPVIFFMFLIMSDPSTPVKVMKITKIVCESFNKSWFVFKECRLRAIKRGVVEVNATATVLHPVHVAHARVEMVRRLNGYKPFLVNFTFDCCAYMAHPNHPFVKVVYENIKDFSNLNHTCPYYGDVMLKRFYLRTDARVVPIIPLPTGEYGVKVTWSFHHLKTAKSDMYFEVIE